MKPSTGAAVRLHRNAVRDRPESLSAFKWNACPPSPEYPAYMPDAAWAVSVHPPSLSRKMGQPPVLTSSNRFSTLQQRFACARLSQSCLPDSCSGFSATFTTVTFDHSSLRWLEINN